jgi:primosomal protein N' (replication factor Y)
MADTAIIGPFPASVNKIKDVFRVNILIKTQVLSKVTNQLAILSIACRRDIIVDIDPVNVL